MTTISASVGLIGSKQCTNRRQDQLVIIDLLNRIPESKGGALYGEGAALTMVPETGFCHPSLHEAILNFQRKNVAHVRYVDGHVDPGGMTLAIMDSLANGTSVMVAGDPKALAEAMRGRAIAWVRNAQSYLAQYRHFLVLRSKPATFSTRFFETHFLRTRVKGLHEAGFVQHVTNNYFAIQATLTGSVQFFEAVSDATAKAEDLSYRKGIFVPAYTHHVRRKICFTPKFVGLRPNCRAAILIHECAHFIDGSIGDGPEKGPGYDGQTPEQALHNACCYPNFAEHVTPPFRDERFGLSKPHV